MADFDSARAKLARANEHLEVFDAEVREFFGSDPYPLTHEFDYLDGVHRWRADLSEPLPSHWPLLVGDCVHNLRSALDHLTWQLAGAKQQDRTTQFPIFATHVLFDKYGRNQIKSVPRRPRTVIEWLQPCRRANPTDDSLFLVQVFDAEDKHKAITLTGTVVDQLRFIPTTPIAPGSKLALNINGENFPVYGGKPNAVIAEGSAILTGPGNASAYYMDVQIEATFGVAMSAESEGMTVARANLALREASECVERVLQAFERYA